MKNSILTLSLILTLLIAGIVNTAEAQLGRLKQAAGKVIDKSKSDDNSDSKTTDTKAKTDEPSTVKMPQTYKLEATLEQQLVKAINDKLSGKVRDDNLASTMKRIGLEHFTPDTVVFTGQR